MTNSQRRKKRLRLKDRPYQRAIYATDSTWEKIQDAAALAKMSKNAFVLKWALHGAATELAKTAGEAKNE